MASKDRPGPGFIALRAAALGMTTLSRQALRACLLDGLDHHGHPVPAYAAPSEPATQVIVAGVLALPAAERAAYRQGLSRWTDYTGRIITPQEHERRLEVLREAHPPASRSMPNG